VDLLTDILGGGASSRLFQSLVKEKKIFSNIDCYHYGSLDPGLLAIEGKLVKGVSMDLAEAAVDNELDRLIREGLDSRELDKAKHKAESMMAFEDMGLANRAASLAFYELLGDAGMMNSELEKYQAVDGASVMDEARSIFKPSNSNTLYYCAHAE
jgi:predicted Zn-dependent peptidase